MRGEYVHPEAGRANGSPAVVGIVPTMAAVQEIPNGTIIDYN